MIKAFCICLGIGLMGSGVLFAQQKRLSLEVNYGIQRNFFVDDYDESPDGFSDIKFYNKQVMGSIGGLELKYRIGKRGRLGLGYAGSSNQRAISFSGVINGVSIGIIDFNISHKNRFYQFNYEFAAGGKRSDFAVEAGLFYLRTFQQEMELSTFNRRILIEERNFNNSRLEEGGAFVGVSYMRKIDTRFRFGVRSRFYYLISTSSPEALTITPVLSYNF